MCIGSQKPPPIPEAPKAPDPPERLAVRVENPEAAGTGSFGKRRRGKSALLIPRRGLNIPS
ncbi:MAG: hypothetical protein GY753_07000 [Gammaproteobacteria bacterium]|nr:hypothetical protein [Gammaproteobacteria bacterium]